jgi:hypothetical protein
MSIEIVAACQFQDHVYIFCRGGEVYRMASDPLVGVVFQLIARLNRG